MTPSWPAATPLTSCVTSTGRSTSLGFHHLPNKKAGRIRTHLVCGDHWQGLAQGQHRMGKLRPVTPRSHLLRTRPQPKLHVSFHLILAGVTSGFWSASHAPARGCLMRRAVGYFILQTWKHRAEFTAPACPIVEPALNPSLTRRSETRAESLVRTSLAVQSLRL